MADQRHIYGKIDNKTNLYVVFLAIRHDVDDATSRKDLTELYRCAGYLVALSYAPAWQEKFGKAVGEIRHVAEEEFARTARKINGKAEEVGTVHPVTSRRKRNGKAGRTKSTSPMTWQACPEAGRSILSSRSAAKLLPSRAEN